MNVLLEPTMFLAEGKVPRLKSFSLAMRTKGWTLQGKDIDKDTKFLLFTTVPVGDEMKPGQFCTLDYDSEILKLYKCPMLDLLVAEEYTEAIRLGKLLIEQKS